jgi:type IV secretory pathway TrbL component
MSEERKDLKAKVTDVTEKAAEIASDVGGEVKAKGEQALDSSAKGAREVAAGAKRNKAQVAVTGAVAAVVAAVLAGWRIIRRRKS